jgi:hypothetical protein
MQFLFVIKEKLKIIVDRVVSLDHELIGHCLMSHASKDIITSNTIVCMVSLKKCLKCYFSEVPDMI